MAAAASSQRPPRGTNNNVTPTKVPKKICEDLPRTGVEYPVMKMPTRFLESHPPEEPLTEV